MREKILSHKDDFIFFYSNAHLFDLQDDKTNIKYKEMEFMQSIVDGNHLIYDGDKLVVLKQSPYDSFKAIGNINDLSWLENMDISKITGEQRKVLNNIIDIYMRDSNGKLGFDWIIKRTPLTTDKLQMDKLHLISFLKNISYNLYENVDKYKKMRDNAIAEYNPKLITTKEGEVFDAQLSSAPLGLSFVELIRAILMQTGSVSFNSAMKYYISYMLLDLLGINKETRKKIKLRNMETDCYHSFFGSYCDCIVTEDEGMRQKSKTLYQLFHFDTKVYSVDEFIEKFDEAIKNNKKSADEYFKEINSDYQAKQVLRRDIINENVLMNLKTSNEYFGYFSCMLERKSKEETVIILHKNYNINKSILVKEIKIIVNRMVRVFNEMGAHFSLFDETIELPQLKADNWYRLMRLNDADVCLTKFKEKPMLCLWIKLKEQ